MTVFPKKILFLISVMVLSAALSGCAAFLEDYSYQPVGAMSSGGSY